jgi:hypothetical protein
MRSHPNILLLRTRKLNEAEKAFQRLRRDEFDPADRLSSRGTPNEMHHQRA